MECFLINYKNNILGVYTDIDQAILFIKSCLSNKLMVDSAEILVFTTNSCYCTKKLNITLDKVIEPVIRPDNKIIKPIIHIDNNKIIKKEIDFNDPTFLKLAEDKIILQHKINMLKVLKDKIKESECAYEHDLKLYHKFKENLIDDTKFIIPELFKDKFLILKKLENENKLNCENFVKEYDHDNTYSDYFKLNSYDESFIDNNKKSDINDEFEINSDNE